MNRATLENQERFCRTEMAGRGRSRGGDTASVGRSQGVRGRGRGTATQRSSAGGCDVGGAVRDQVLEKQVVLGLVRYFCATLNILSRPSGLGFQCELRVC